MKELVVISGKGGTGKTSLTASFAALARKAVLADCDVDASDLHLLLAPESTESNEFQSGRKAQIVRDKCISCGACLARCKYDAVKMDMKQDDKKAFSIDELSCEGCGLCVRICPVGAIDFPENFCGKIYRSKTRFGEMVHATLDPGAGNSGKLVSEVRRKARVIAQEKNAEIIIADGPPGIACPVIASITGANLIVAVAEPTVSGVHDTKRVLELAEHFSIPTIVCVNKYDINPRQADDIAAFSEKSRIVVATSKISYDENITKAQLKGMTAVEHSRNGAAEEMAVLWNKIIKEFI